MLVSCPSCGLIRLDPRPGPTVLPSYYGDDYYSYGGRSRSPRRQALWNWLRDFSAVAVRPWWARGPVGWALRRAIRRQFDVDLGPGPGRRRVLDFGSGYGDLLLYLRSRGHEVYGVEFDERAALAGARMGIPIHVGRLETLPEPEGSFDVAIAQHSLEHVPDPDAVIAGLARVLRPGGELHLAVPNGASAGLRVERERWGALFFPLHLWFFDARALEVLLRRHGLEPVWVGHSTIWHNHTRVWKVAWAAIGPRATLSMAVRFLVARVVRSDGGDVVRVVARKAGG